MADLAGIAEWINAVKASGSEGYKGADGYAYVWDNDLNKAVTKFVMVDGKPTLRFAPVGPDLVAVALAKKAQSTLAELRKHLEG